MNIIIQFTDQSLQREAAKLNLKRDCSKVVVVKQLSPADWTYWHEWTYLHEGKVLKLEDTLEAQAALELAKKCWPSYEFCLRYLDTNGALIPL